MEKVSSRQNALVKRFRALARRRDDDLVLLDGPHLLEEALRSGVAIETAAFSEGTAEGRLAELARQVERAGARVVTASDAVFGAFSPVRHPSGVVAVARIEPATVESILARRPPLVLLLDAVQDPGNVGAIVRAAESCGATGVIAGAGSADPFGWKALRGAMGSSFRVPTVPRADMAAAVRQLRAAGVRIFAAAPRGGKLLPDSGLRGPAAILLGGEGAGISEALQDGVDERLTIPMQGSVESLNVAVAAALVLYEASRQRADVAV